ncbi:uncharacterized protein N0V89_001305 [Didymosphaeria variabile]|uniref:Xylanolytic transcriptional activator regulatory domain-containing protein n=1 Tax=Didymosphaeria variabile TaxID=1932322 RepID=A0A9W9CFS0_9PLEO|nr:uncharacterized protein N0V89_001305 [Didymosphaeria variabile]KAJ4360738.1 hypothetical protein N0V89_001305 [Didymosphaeria variabile]
MNEVPWTSDLRLPPAPLGKPQILLPRPMVRPNYPSVSMELLCGLLFTPILDRFQFFSSTLHGALESEFGYDVETCLVLIVLALGCLAVRAYEEGDFALPSRTPSATTGFARPEWYEVVMDDPPGLKFFNEARQRIGFLMNQNDLPIGQFYMLCTLYYAQTLRPIDSWTMVNRAALCCISVLSREETIDFDDWEGDMFSRLFWNTLMYETIITQELSLPLSGLLDYEADIPIPKFKSSPRPKTSISGLLSDEDDSFFNFHFLAQAAHRIILTRIRRVDHALNIRLLLTDF